MSKTSVVIVVGMLLLPAICAADPAASGPPNAPVPHFINTGHPAADKKAFITAVHRHNDAIVAYWERQARLKHIQKEYHKG